jgi:hypothetical protein
VNLNISAQQFLEKLNDLNSYLLFPEEHSKQFDQDKTIEILDQSKAPEWHDAIGTLSLKF